MADQRSTVTVDDFTPPPRTLSLSAVERAVVFRGYEQLFLLARVSVLGFYLKAGYAPVGEEFMQSGIPHLKMTKRIGASV